MIVPGGRLRRLVRSALIGLHQVEGELRRLADERLQALRIAEAGRLDQDAVVALALDARLGRAELVDAAVDDLDRLVDDAAHALGQAGGRIGEADEAVVGDRQVELVDGAAAEEAGVQRVAQRLQALARIVELVEVADAELHRLALDAEAGIADARLLEHRLADVADQRPQPLLDVVGAVDLVEEIGAALQVEAEHHLLLRQEARPVGERLLREEIRNDGEEPGGDDSQDQDDLPARKMKHLSHSKDRRRRLPSGQPFSLTGSPLARTSAIVPRTTRTRTPSASST